MWNGAAEALKPSPAISIARPARSRGSSPTLRGGDLREADRAGRPVDERRAEEQDRRAERAHDQVLQPGLQRRLAVRVHRAEDVERDREPLEPEEERHQVRGGDEEDHASRPPPRAGRSTRRRGRAARRPRRRARPGCLRPAMISAENAPSRSRVNDSAISATPCVVSSKTIAAKTPDVMKPAKTTIAAKNAAHPRRARARCRAERRPRRGEQRQRRRERQPVDLRGRDHGTASAAARRRPAASRARRSSAGQAERKSSSPTSGTTIASSNGRTSARVLADVAPAGGVEHGRDQAQHVHRGEHDPGGTDDGPAPGDAVDAGEDQELARERDRAGHRERDDPGRHQQSRQHRSPARHPAQAREGARAGARLDHACEQEERRRDEPVCDRLEDRSVDPELVQREEPHRDEAHLRHRGVRRHAADVGRAEGEQRRVDEPDRREREDRRLEVVDRLGELPDHDPQQAVDRRLGDDAGEDRRHLRRRLAVGLDEPAVEREDRRLDGECDQEAEEDPVVRGDARVDERERVLREPEDDDRRQHQQRPGHRVDHERRRRADAPRPAPDADQDVDRDQHRLEEDVEDEQVLGGEDADDRARQEEQQAVVAAAAVASRPERVPDRDRADDDGEAGEEEREAVEADVVGDAEIARTSCAGPAAAGPA